ncbi:MAG: type II toxin-antitoxin system VapC family toxin [Burkholderiales bacterium]|nr:type II toxin-antitoxin system VapC family toxin [Burkholderiales bacterium]
MTIYLLDTNIASHIIKSDIPRVRERLVAAPMHSIAVSVVTQAELLYGVAKRGHPQGLATKVREFLARVTICPWTTEAAVAYGILRAACEADGVTLAPMDMMIAAHAKALAGGQGQPQVVLVTRDATFSRIRPDSGLTLEDWTV